MKLIYIPNIVTLLRILLVIPVLVSLSRGAYQWAFFLFLLAGISDAVDGFLARRFHCLTRFGSILDPLADKLLMIATFLMLSYLGLIPLWLLLVVISRDLIIVAGGIAYHVFIGVYEFQPSLLSKLNTFLQILLIVVIIFEQSYHLLDNQWIDGLMMVILATNIASLMHYMWVWGGRALRSL